MKPIWVEEYIKSIAYSIVIKGFDSGTPIRQAFILLDNSFEQYMNECVQDKKERVMYRQYKKLLESFSMKVSLDLLDYNRILEYHEIRNAMYHRNNYFIMANERFEEYLKIIIKYSVFNEQSLEGDIYAERDKIVSELNNKIYSEKIKKRHDNKLRVDSIIKEILIKEFDFRGNQYIGELLLGEYPGVNITNLEEIEFLIEGYVKTTDDKIYFLELIDSNCENPYHSFLISRENSDNWKCFYDSFWSKTGDGNSYYVKKIRLIANRYPERVIYKTTFIRGGLLRSRFEELAD